MWLVDSCTYVCVCVCGLCMLDVPSIRVNEWVSGWVSVRFSHFGWFAVCIFVSTFHNSYRRWQLNWMELPAPSWCVSSSVVSVFLCHRHAAPHKNHELSENHLKLKGSKPFYANKCQETADRVQQNQFNGMKFSCFFLASFFVHCQNPNAIILLHKKNTILMTAS